MTSTFPDERNEPILPPMQLFKARTSALVCAAVCGVSCRPCPQVSSPAEPIIFPAFDILEEVCPATCAGRV